MGGRRIASTAGSILGNVLVPVIGGAAAGAAIDGKEGMKRGAIGGISNVLMMPGVGDIAMGFTKDSKKKGGDVVSGAQETAEEKAERERLASEGGQDPFDGALGVTTKKKKLNTLVGGYSSGALSGAGIGGTSTTLG